MAHHLTLRLFSFVFTLGLCSSAFAQELPIRPAKVFTVAQSDSVIRRKYPATVLPSQEVQLSFKVSGQIIELPIRAASEVAEGDIIAKIDPRDYESQVAQLESQADQAQAQLDALSSGARSEEISALEAALASAQAQLDQAQDSLERTEALVERGVATTAQLEQVRAQFRVAEANLKAQNEQLRIGQAGGRPEEIAAAEAALRGLKAQLDSARDSLADTTLTAPFDGIIARRDIENFANIRAGEPVALLQGLDIVHLAFDVPGPDVIALTRRGPDRIENIAEFEALPGQLLPGELVEFSVQADSTTLTYRGRVAVAVPEDSYILPGMIAQVTSSIDGDAPELRIPLAALSAASDATPFVWKVDDENRVAKQVVRLGEASGTQITVLEGVEPGMRIIAAGVSQIIDGMQIQPLENEGN